MAFSQTSDAKGRPNGPLPADQIKWLVNPKNPNDKIAIPTHYVQFVYDPVTDKYLCNVVPNINNVPTKKVDILKYLPQTIGTFAEAQTWLGFDFLPSVVRPPTPWTVSAQQLNRSVSQVLLTQARASRISKK